MEKEDPSIEQSKDLADLLNSDFFRKSQEINTDEYPDVVPVLPIKGRVFMVGMTAPVVVEAGIYYSMLKELTKKGGKFVGLFLTKDPSQNIYKLTSKDVHKVGVVARIVRILNVQESGCQVILNIEQRITAKSFKKQKKNSLLAANVDYFFETPPKTNKTVIQAYTSNLIKKIRELITLNPMYKEELQIFLNHVEFTQPGKICDFAVALTSASREDMQDILQTFPLKERLKKALIIISKECDMCRLQLAINQKIESSVMKTQKEFFLREQLKTIQRELGEHKDDRQVDIEKFQTRADALKMSKEAQEVFDEELQKLQVLEPSSAEYGVVRTYLDVLTQLPWGIQDKETKHLKEVARILDKDHYGLKEVKERILEIISVSMMKKSGMKGHILCLVGPPGTGKTSVGKSIARALGRKFYRFSVGGMHDESEIKGHRRTYVGAMPGKILQALKVCKAENPLIMLDEVDKIGTSYRGDPASALLEALDPEQNAEFLDHYLDIRFDLSKVLFVLTANVIDSIPEALRDRMEIISLSGYVEQEKLMIAKRYFIPKILKDTGLKKTDCVFQESALKKMITAYFRETGVRKLEQGIKKILQKVTKEKVEASEKSKRKKTSCIEITEKSLEKFLGKPPFHADKFYGEGSLVGICTGLAWTPYGGNLLYIETSSHRGKERINLTGSLGDVMKESANVSYAYLQSEQERFFPEGIELKDQEVSLHVPEGAIPKDGPSAGITMTTAMISLFRQEEVAHDIAMTGEMTLRGKVLAVGGVKEKVLAARREGISDLILPSGNKKDWEELPAYLRKNLHPHFVSEYKQVYDLVFQKNKKKQKRRAKRKG